MTENLGPFRAQLQTAVNARHSRMNPFTEKWVNGELTRGHLASWVCQHYQYVSQFPRWCATIYGNCPDADARDFLLDPESYLRAMCRHVGVDFTPRMLAWPPGRRDSDGVWGRHWYDAVWRSTGFAEYRPRDPQLDSQAAAVAEECRSLYERLHGTRWVL